MSRYGKEAEKQAHSYVDGVPVKISEKYKPPRKITLPVGYQHRLPVTAVSEEYEFSLEHSILEKMVEWQKLQQNASEERKQRIKLAELTVTERVPKVDKKPHPVHTGGGTAVVVSVSSNNVDSSQQQQIQYSSILTPVPISTPINNSTNSINNSYFFNISDFEADTSSPFDNMELKTINDMEELAHVLQPTVTSAPETATHSYTLPYNSCHQFNMLESSKPHSSVLNNINDLNDCKLLKDELYSTLPAEQKNVYNCYPGYWGDNGDRTETTNHRSSHQDTGGASTSLSKSVPDIMKELDRELREKRRGVTPPATSALRPASIGSTGLENWKPWPDLDSPEQNGTMRHHLQQRPICALPDPFPELSLQEQQFSKRISEMGFPLPRVSRICQLLGEDDKKVVEFLLQVQSFEEKGYPADRAERALTVNECSFTEAEKCLIATGQLLDLGFSEDKVAEALARSNNNRDQALEYLIS